MDNMPNTNSSVADNDSLAADSKSGFTIIEVMLVLAITGLMLAGVIAGTYSAIATQRYNDSVRSFSEFLRQVFSEVISPQSYGAGNSDEEAVYGKIIVFGINDESDTAYTATLVGGVHPPRDEDSFIAELGSIGEDGVKAHIFCEKEVNGKFYDDSVDSYSTMWEARIETPGETGNTNKPLKGTLIIARSPSTGTVHTAFTETAYNVKNDCQGASDSLKKDLQNNQVNFDQKKDLDFCIVSDDSRIVRDIRLGADARNSSAINLISTDEGDSRCAQN